MVRQTRGTFWSAVLLTLTVAMVLSTVPLGADDRPWTVRGMGVWIDGGFDHGSDPSDPAVVQFEGDWGGGLHAALEYRASPRLGLELGHLIGGVGTTLTRIDHGRYATETRTLGFSSLLLGLNVYLTPSEEIQVYLTPIVGYVWFAGWDFDGHGHGESRVSVGDELAWGGGLGIDVPIAKSRWSVTVVAKYLDTAVDTARRGSETFETNFDPLMIGVGFGFRF